MHEAWYNRGIALSDLGRKVEAIASYDKAIEIKPDYHEAWNNRGYALLKQGNLLEGFKNIQQSIAIEPLYPSYCSEAYAYILMNNIDLAIESIQYALSCNSEKREEILGDPDFDSIRDHPRFQALIQGE